ncbi:MAG: hypothetical protein HQ463_00555 [Bacteroidetes bacterium]|nr:hypothetical protein [Bacteroidota bacterium]
MKINKLIVALFCIILIQNLTAQNNTRSPYSIRNIGELEQFGSAFTRSLSGSANGIRSTRFISFANPASVSALAQVSFEFGFHGDYGRYATKTAAKTYNNGNFSYFSLGFPLLRKEIIKKDTSRKNLNEKKNSIIKSYKTFWASAIGLSPYSNIGASYFKTTDTTYGQTTNFYSYSGGLNRFFLMNGVNLNKNFSLGLNSSFIFGQIKNEKAYYVNDSNVSRATSNLSIYNFTGFKFDFGFQGVSNDTFTIKDSVRRCLDTALINNFKVPIYKNVYRERKNTLRFTYGATVNNNAALNYKLTRSAINISNLFSNSSIDTLINQSNVKSKTYLPSGFSAGISLVLNNKYMLAFDYKSDFLSNQKRPLFNDVFINSAHYIFGFAYRPDLEPEQMKTRQIANKSKRFKANLEYRFGCRFLNTGYNYKDNMGNISSLKEYGFSFGIGIPKLSRTFDPQIPYLKSIINLTGEYIHRGTTNNGLIAEDIFKLTIGIILDDNWFVKRKFN